MCYDTNAGLQSHFAHLFHISYELDKFDANEEKVVILVTIPMCSLGSVYNDTIDTLWVSNILTAIAYGNA